MPPIFISLVLSLGNLVPIPQVLPMAATIQHPFAPFNKGNPLNISQHDDILVVALKSLSFFTREDHTTSVDHIQDVATLCSVHNISQENVALRLLVVSLKWKALQWFRGLQLNSIEMWDELGDGLHWQFEDKSNHLSLLEKLSTIKRVSHEHMVDFNYWFQRTWD